MGEDFPLMLDCYMSLTVPYAINLAHRLAPIGLKWMEEYLQPDDYAGHAAVQQATQSLPVMLATAEHEYSRFGYKQLIDARMVDILQPDITWLGGITEARRVVAMASAAGISVIPHGSSVFSYHLALASPSIPMSEFVTPALDSIKPYFGGLFEGEPLPNRGSVDLGDAPGFGLTLLREGLVRPFEREQEWSRLNAAANIHFKEPPVRMKL